MEMLGVPVNEVMGIVRSRGRLCGDFLKWTGRFRGMESFPFTGGFKRRGDQ